MTRFPSVLDAINLDHALEFSYEGHHTERIDYLCLFRSNLITLKAYFFDEGSDDAVVVPHTHRYDFQTYVACGQLEEVRFTETGTSVAGAWESMTYDALVEGGRGFKSLNRRVNLNETVTRYWPGHSYFNRAHYDIHTLRKVEPGTILILTQFADRGDTTLAWRRVGKPMPECHAPTSMRVNRVYARIEQLMAVPILRRAS